MTIAKISVHCILKFKADNINVNFPTQFYLKSISNPFSTVESREVSSKENVTDFLVDHNAINIYVILNVHKYLMVKKDICSGLLNKCLLDDQVLENL